MRTSRGLGAILALSSAVTELIFGVRIHVGAWASFPDIIREKALVSSQHNASDRKCGLARAPASHNVCTSQGLATGTSGHCMLRRLVGHPMHITKAIMATGGHRSYLEVER